MPTIDELGRDLLVTTRAQRNRALARPLLGVAAFAALWAAGLRWLAPLGLAATFTCVIGTTHDFVHGSLGLRRHGRDAVLCLLPLLILQCGHVYRTTHPQHHRVFPGGGTDDPEGLVADAGLVRTLVEGPLFLPRLWLWSWRRVASHVRQRRFLVAEAAAIPLALVAGLLLLRWSAAPLTWVLLSLAAGWLLPLVTVWLPHRHHGETPETSATSLRWPVVPRLLLGLTYHLEHHLYPQVPSHRMHELAHRLEPWLGLHELRAPSRRATPSAVRPDPR